MCIRDSQARAELSEDRSLLCPVRVAATEPRDRRQDLRDRGSRLGDGSITERVGDERPCLLRFERLLVDDLLQVGVLLDVYKRQA